MSYFGDAPGATPPSAKGGSAEGAGGTSPDPLAAGAALKTLPNVLQTAMGVLYEEPCVVYIRVRVRMRLSIVLQPSVISYHITQISPLRIYQVLAPCPSHDQPPSVQVAISKVQGLHQFQKKTMAAAALDGLGRFSGGPNATSAPLADVATNGGCRDLNL